MVDEARYGRNVVESVDGQSRMRLRIQFPAISLLIPWSISNRPYLCGFRKAKFFAREKFPATFPASGIHQKVVARRGTDLWRTPALTRVARAPGAVGCDDGDTAQTGEVYSLNRSLPGTVDGLPCLPGIGTVKEQRTGLCVLRARSGP